MAQRKGLSICDLEKQVAEQIIDLMKTKGLSWTQAWQRPRPACNGITGHVYRGTNVLTTWLWLMCNDKSDPRFIARSALFNKDPEQRVGKLRKGEKGIPIVFYKTVEKTDENGDEGRYRFARVHWVWHVSQIDDLDEAKLVEPAKDPAPENEIERIIAVDEWIRNTKAKVRHEEARAYYHPCADYINMPKPDTFYTTEGYYGVLLHELTHWTGADTRLDRKIKNQFGDHDYAFEELVAEIGSVMLGTEHGIQIGPREDNAAYIKSWMKRLGEEPRLIFDAARKASAAVDFLNNLQPAEQKEAA